jgi:hypothetical protein
MCDGFNAGGRATDAPADMTVDNFPNPFNPTTEIAFALPRMSHVRLEVCSIMGRKIATLVDAQFDAGYHSITWNASGVATGLCFCRIQAGDCTDTKRMLLLK